MLVKKKTKTVSILYQIIKQAKVEKILYKNKK